MNGQPVNKKPAHILRDALKQDMFPFLEKKGFVLLKARGDSIDFLRKADSKVHCLHFQWDKYARPMFRVHIANGPISGVPQYGGGFIPGEDLRAWQCLGEKAFLLPRPGRFCLGRAWFSLRFGWIFGYEQISSKITARFISLFPECEAWWQNKSYGPHLRRNKSSELMLKKLQQRHGRLAWNSEAE